MKRFEELVSRCKSSVTLTAREHTVNYETVQEYMDRERDDHFEIDGDTYRRASEAGFVYELQFYPDTPIGFYRVFGATVDEAVDRAIAILDAET